MSDKTKVALLEGLLCDIYSAREGAPPPPAGGGTLMFRSGLEDETKRLLWGHPGLLSWWTAEGYWGPLEIIEGAARAMLERLRPPLPCKLCGRTDEPDHTKEVKTASCFACKRPCP